MEFSNDGKEGIALCAVKPPDKGQGQPPYKGYPYAPDRVQLPLFGGCILLPQPGELGGVRGLVPRLQLDLFGSA